MSNTVEDRRMIDTGRGQDPNKVVDAPAEESAFEVRELGPAETKPYEGFEVRRESVVGHDPWAHRSAGMRCASCMWWVEKRGVDTRSDKLGRCRRRSPTMNGYPAVYQSDWCGDHKMRE